MRNDLYLRVFNLALPLRRVCAVAALATAAACSTVQAASAIEECADSSPTQAALSDCLDSRLAAAERELSIRAQVARQQAQAIRNREQRTKALRALDRAQRRFFAAREQECGSTSPEAMAESERGNKIRNCMIRVTREQAGLAGMSSVESVETPAVPEASPTSRAQPDPVYGVDWRLTRLIRDNKEVALPPKYRANLRLETDGRVSGYGAASAFTGRFRLRSAGKIEWAENGFLITHDARQPDPTQIDYLYVDSLERATRAGLSKTGLVLRSEDGSISLSFER